MDDLQLVRQGDLRAVCSQAHGQEQCRLPMFIIMLQLRGQRTMLDQIAGTAIRPVVLSQLSE